MTFCSNFVSNCLLVMFVQNEDVLDIYSGHRFHGSLDLKGTDLYKLVGFGVSKTLFRVVSV